MSDVRVLKFDVGSTTDQALDRLRQRFDASSMAETVRRSLGLADTVTKLHDEGNRIFVRDPQGNIRELLL